MPQQQQLHPQIGGNVSGGANPSLAFQKFAYLWAANAGNQGGNGYNAPSGSIPGVASGEDYGAADGARGWSGGGGGHSSSGYHHHEIGDTHGKTLHSLLVNLNEVLRGVTAGRKIKG